MSGFVLGLDGGGTQTRAVLTDLAGVSAGGGTAGACNLAAVSPAEALANALAAADGALQTAGGTRADVLAVCAGVAGYSHTERREQFRQGLGAAFPNAQVTVEPDYGIALAGATRGAPGVLVVAGTGSAAYGRNAAGETHRAGAYGYLVDDGGSGYGVGRGALAAILAAADGTGPATVLTERILTALRLSSLADIVPGVYGGGISRVAVAGLSRIVAEAAEVDADPVARALLMRAGGTLALLVRGVTERVFAEAREPFPVVQVGGLWAAGGVLTDVFVRSLCRFAPAAVVSIPLSTPAEGAARQALERLNAEQKKSPAS